MYQILLFLHFFGISIGAGTGIYLLAVNRHASRNLEQAEARTLMPGIAGTLSRIGTIGLLLLIVSGTGLVYSMNPAVLSDFFKTKMVLVFVLVSFVILMNVLARRVRTKGDMTAAGIMKRLAILGPVLGVLVIASAVLSFH